MTNNWFGWIVIAFLTLWLLALIAFTCMSLLVRCVDFNEDGNLVLKRIGRRFRRNVGDRSLVTKVSTDIKSHDSSMRDCVHLSVLHSFLFPFVVLCSANTYMNASLNLIVGSSRPCFLG